MYLFNQTCLFRCCCLFYLLCTHQQVTQSLHDNATQSYHDPRGHHDHDRMVDGFITTYAIIAYHH